MRQVPRPFWSPYAAGIVLGLGLLLTFVTTGHGMGASGFITRFSAVANDWMAPAATAANSYLGPYIKAGAPLMSWITWEFIGLLIGAWMGAKSAGRISVKVERGPKISGSERLGWALFGGILVGFGARLARGCTSGVGLSGGATLAVAGFVFLAGFFATGFVIAALMRRVWH